MVFGQEMAFKTQDNCVWDKAVLSQEGRQLVKKTDEIWKQSQQVDLRKLNYDWLKI